MSNNEMPEWMRKLIESGQIKAGRDVNISTGQQTIVNIGGNGTAAQGAKDGEDVNIATYKIVNGKVVKP